MRVSHKKLILILVIVAAIGYGLWQARNFLSGPKIYLESPKEGEILKDSILIIKGEAFGATSLVLNGRDIFTNEDGKFIEEIILAPGVTEIELYAKDRFGHEETIRRMILVE